MSTLFYCQRLLAHATGIYGGLSSQKFVKFIFHAWKDATYFVHSNGAFGWFFQIVIIEFISKSNHIVTNHAVDGQSMNSTFGFRGNGFFNRGLTTIRRKRTRKVYYNQIEGGLAHCTIFDKNNNRLISDESVLNGEIYQLTRFGEYFFLEPKGLTLSLANDWFFQLSNR